MASFTKILAKNKQGYKWICTKDGPADLDTGERRQIKRRGDTKALAEARVDAVIKAQESGINTRQTKGLRFQDLADEWLLDYERSKVKPPTIEQRKFCVSVLKKKIGRMVQDKITSGTYQKLLNELFDDEYAHSTIIGINATANMIFKFALRMKYRKENPVSGSKIPEKILTVEELENSPISEKYLERDELALFLNTARDAGKDLDEEIVYTLAFTGMRIGELIAIKFTDLNRALNRIRITKTASTRSTHSNYVQGTPKTKGSIREFEVDPFIMEMLWNLKERNNDSEFVLSRNGKPMLHATIELRFQRLLRKSGIKKHVTPHTLRHTHISMLAEAEVDLRMIMKRVGHDEPKTTLKIYTHVTEKMQRNVVEKLKNVFSDLLETPQLQEM
ncbi:site-specific integrase [Paenibacillus sp. OV219]|uniref:tyrosine-type recombinase/integrase n=1 Tax=Paenibacillus sp. OV219 TaxID=1884377 RepID=UPI0008D3C72F|nr:site-specific integrase [Paenibacillus sp. OV219]SEM80483.1 Site-specific recombinase XerD [Paenibacillus sp. OV219]